MQLKSRPNPDPNPKHPLLRSIIPQTSPIIPLKHDLTAPFSSSTPINLLNTPSPQRSQSCFLPSDRQKYLEVKLFKGYTGGDLSQLKSICAVSGMQVLWSCSRDYECAWKGYAFGR